MPVVADELVLKIDSNVTGAISGMNKVEGRANSLGKNVAAGALKWGGRIAAAGVVAGVGVAVGASKMAMSFDSAMAQIEANVGTTGEDLQTLKDAALGMGKDFGIGATEAASGLFFLQSAGLGVQDSIDALTVSSKMASMGLGDMETIANGLTTAMTNWGISSEQAGNVVAKAVELGKSAPEEMTKILNQNAAAASAVGLEFDDLATVTAYLTRVTGDANKSGTQMQGMLAKLIKPSQMGRSALDGIGMSIEDVRDLFNADPFSAMQIMDERFASAGVASNDWMGQVFEDVNAINGAMSLLNAKGAEVSAMQDSMADRAGKVDAGFAVIADTAEFKFGAAMESLKSALIPIGEVLLDIVVPAVEWLGEKLQWAIEWVQGMTDGSNEMSEGVGNAFTKVMDFATNLWETIQNVFGYIQEIFAIVGPTASAMFTDMSAIITPLVENLGTFLMTTFGGVVEWFQENWPKIKETVETVMNAIKAVFDIVLPAMKAIFEATFSWIKIIVETTLNVILGIIEVIMGVITGDWDAAWAGIQRIVDAIWNAIKGIVSTFINLIKGILAVVMGHIATAWETSWNKIKEVFGNVWEGIKNVAKGAINSVAGMIEGLVNSVIGGLNVMIRAWNSANLFMNFADIPEIGGVTMGRMESGGFTNYGQTVRVGENGPENLSLPGGSKVTPLTASDSGGGGVTVYIGEREFNDFVINNSTLGSDIRSRRRTRGRVRR